MDSPLRMGMDYSEPKHFDPKEYLAMSCSPQEGSEDEKYFRNVHLKEVHKIFDSGVVQPGSRLLDIGTGPTVYQLISASRFCTEIVCAEYAEANRAEVLKWIKGEPDAYDWNSSFQYVADLEGDSSSWEARKLHLRDAIKAVIPCDVTKPDPLTPYEYEQFDVITSMKCLEVACPTRESYSAAVRSITRLLKPGGTLLMISVISESFHTIGGHKFFTLTVDESFIEEVLKAAGFNAIDIKTFPAPSLNQDSSIWDNNVSDFGGMAVVHARKL